MLYEVITNGLGLIMPPGYDGDPAFQGGMVLLVAYLAGYVTVKTEPYRLLGLVGPAAGNHGEGPNLVRPEW